MQQKNSLYSAIIMFPRFLLAGAIRLYQFLLSPDHSWLKARFPYGYCRHYPSCSEYARQAILSRGAVKGFYWGIKRLVGCHPWAEPKYDPVPER